MWRSADAAGVPDALKALNAMPYNFMTHIRNNHQTLGKISRSYHFLGLNVAQQKKSGDECVNLAERKLAWLGVSIWGGTLETPVLFRFGPKMGDFLVQKRN